MNNHLLPFPYNQSQSSTWLDRVVQPLSDLLFGGLAQYAPEKAPATPVVLSSNGSGLPPIRIVCISDTHNATPSLPPGDILIHAGDLTVNGTFDEVQAQLRWLASQAHTHKIVIAGNHDILLDAACDTRFLTREGDPVEERQRLDWSDIQYLQNEDVTVEVSAGCEGHTRRLKIFGTPLTPELGSWAFQYPTFRDVWTGRVPDDTDILVVHGPPALYGDCDGEKRPSGQPKVKGDGYLLREIRRVKPKMVVCRHIHGAFGLAVVQYDGTQDAVNGLQMRWEGYSLTRALKQAFWSKISAGEQTECPRETLVFNAAFAPAPSKSHGSEAIVIDYH